mmetsp:Transcript_133927/g.199166  ORF Transcript_133927/g.199166 Transcript_133927/m.199166 type:complete len:125 (+) Transcript_133927:195-569(+)
MALSITMTTLCNVLRPSFRAQRRGSTTGQRFSSCTSRLATTRVRRADVTFTLLRPARRSVCRSSLLRIARSKHMDLRHGVGDNRRTRQKKTCAQMGRPGKCCSQWGYCGTGQAYCGRGCQHGCW